MTRASVSVHVQPDGRVFVTVYSRNADGFWLMNGLPRVLSTNGGARSGFTPMTDNRVTLTEFDPVTDGGAVQHALTLATLSQTDADSPRRTRTPLSGSDGGSLNTGRVSASCRMPLASAATGSGRRPRDGGGSARGGLLLSAALARVRCVARRLRFVGGGPFLRPPLRL